MAKVGRNDPCPCGSGKKYKRCCWEKAQFPKRKAREAEHAAWLERQKLLTPEERARKRRSVQMALLSMAALGTKYARYM